MQFSIWFCNNPDIVTTEVRVIGVAADEIQKIRVLIGNLTIAKVDKPIFVTRLYQGSDMWNK